jgi:hypothetical protein
MSAMSDITTALVNYSDAISTIASSSAQVASLIQDAKLADAKATLEGQLATTSLTSYQGIYRIYRSADVWRAKALVESARRYAVAARRAIEARYVVDLTQMDQNEPFVASPTLWADQVYTYDLDLPAAVGLTVSGAPTGQQVYSNQVSDYVANLQAFLAGYAAARPAAVADNELDLVTLPGLAPSASVGSADAGAPDGGDAGATDAAADATASDAAADAGPPPPTTAIGPMEWVIHCPFDPKGTTGPTGSWISIPTNGTAVDAACSVNGAPAHPDHAQIGFSLDPWGRLNSGGIGDPPFVDRFNARWGNLALNFVGTGVKDCTKALDPQGCYNATYIAYNLTQTGPSWVTNYDQAWTFLNTPTSTIEGAKGLAAEIWLDPLKDGWQTQYISAIARTELTLSPLGGAYVLDFAVPPEVVLGNIQRIQLLVGSTAWVKQQQ